MNKLKTASIAMLSIIAIPIIVVIIYLLISLGTLIYVHAHARSVRNEILQTDISLLNEWAIAVYKKENHKYDIVDVKPDDYCEIIKKLNRIM